MGASFEEKSVWVQLGALIVGLAAYAATAALMLSRGVTELPAYAPLFVAAVVLMVVVLIVGHTAAALFGRPEPADERDRLIAWRAESRSAWVVAAGAVCAVGAMTVGVGDVWVAHGLLASLFLSEALGLGLRLVDYRRGLR